MDETIRQNLVMAFNNVLRTSALAGTVDLQRAGLAFSMLLERHEEGPLALAPLSDWLLEQGGPAEAIDEILVFMKSRENRFGLEMVLPPHLQTLPPDRVEALIFAFTSRGATSGTRAGATGNSASGTFRAADARTTSDPSQKAIEPPPQNTKSDIRAENPSSKSSGAPGRSKIMMGIFVVVVVAGVVNAVMMGDDKEKVTQLTLRDTSGLPCTNARVAKTTLLCDLPAGFFKANADEAVQAKGKVTLNEVKGQGVTRILAFDANHKVRTVIDGK